MAVRMVIVVLLAALVAACAGDDDDAIEGGAAKNVAGEQSVRMEANNFQFSPSFLRGTPGQVLQLQIANTSSTPHNLSVSSEGIDVEIPPGGESQVTITFPASGVLQFLCKYHAAEGMAGELLVGDASPSAAGGQPTAGASDYPGY